MATTLAGVVVLGVLGAMLHRLWREVVTMVRQVEALERSAARRRNRPRP